MKFNRFLNELSSSYGKGITFVDIDDTLFHTFAMIKVLKKGKVVKKLNNQEFNVYDLQPGEEFDFGEFRDASFFRKTSVPMDKTINRIKRMFKNIGKRGSKVVLLTAREIFPDMKTFKKTFKENGIPIDNIDVIFYSTKKGPSISKYKENTIMDFIKTGEYRRVRLIDDAVSNINAFLSIQNKIPEKVINKVKEKHNITGEESINPIEFFGLLALDNGSLKRIN